MTYQVLIREKENGKLETILVSPQEINPSSMKGEKILYQRNFEIQRKAEDHKILLDLLSQESLRVIIKEQSKSLSHSFSPKADQKIKCQIT